MDDVVLKAIALEKASRASRLSFKLRPSWSAEALPAPSSTSHSTTPPPPGAKKSLSLVQLRDLANQLASVHHSSNGVPRLIRLRSHSRSKSSTSTTSTGSSFCNSEGGGDGPRSPAGGCTNVEIDVFEATIDAASLPPISTYNSKESSNMRRRRSSITPNLPTITEDKVAAMPNHCEKEPLTEARAKSGYGNNNSTLDCKEVFLRKAARTWLMKALDREFQQEQELLEHRKTNMAGWDPVRSVYRTTSASIPLRVGPKVNNEELISKAQDVKRRVSLKSQNDHHLYGGSAVINVPHYFEVTNGYAKAKLQKKASRGQKLERRKSHQRLIDLVKQAASKPDLEEALKRLETYQMKIVDNNFNCRQNLVKAI